ncbi:non-ribosomal peptide synthetase [Aquimarina mytili]|uniref:Amino acid adenylation domain-containing protein n=1 Tax=Aquimarina mytili TaxID=874423 RepID=A0A937A1B8_9FLAO|nr:non-ribosomal peptide synthetase [Aquimarina mytili]MBL0685051.1 amino acid adenylation domain-containing protein [Aquimarina mytili]
MRIDRYISDLRNHKNIIINVKDGELKIKASENDLTPKVINEIKDRKEEIISFFKSVTKERALITPVKEQEHYAISHAQRRLWITEQIKAANGVYNVPLVYTFKTIDITSFHKAVDALLERHEILRTTIQMVEGEPRQYIHESKEFAFKVNDKKVDTNELESILEQEALLPFDLSVSAIRGTLLRSNEGITLVLVLHHIITDAWSVNVLLKDFLALYNHYSNGTALHLSELKIQYKDYSNWQHSQLKHGELKASKDYWVKKLSGEITTLKLPLDHKRYDHKTHKGATASFLIDKNTSNRLTALGHQHQASLFMVMTAIVKALLYRYTGQEDIIVGTPVSGRNHRELEDQVGFYSNTIVLRSHVKGTFDINQLLEEVSGVLLEAYDHQFYPYDLLVDDLGYERDINRNPLFDVMVSMDDNSTLENGERASEIEYSDKITITDGDVSKFDITFSFLKLQNGCCRVEINYNTSLFEKEKISKMAVHLRNMISSVVKNENQRINSIEYLSQEEKDQILYDFNTTRKDYHINSSIKEYIEINAEKNANSIGVVSSKEQLTFDDINSRANRLSNYLSKTYKVQKGTRIGVMMDQKVDRIITLLSIIKSGAVYVPIDPNDSNERKKYCIDDTQLSLLVTDESCDSIANGDLKVLSLKSIENDVKKESNANPKVLISPEDVCAVFYTSGSTNTPKGARITHKSILNRVHWLWQTYQLNSKDVLYQRTPLASYASIEELFIPFCFCTKLLIAKDRSNTELVDIIKEFGVTYIHFSPTRLNKFLEIEKESASRLSSLRFVFCGGEELLKETVNRYYSKFKTPLINLYGSAEVSGVVSAHQIKLDDKAVPLGKPIANTNVYILDENNKLLPLGVPGEICVSSVCLPYTDLDLEAKEHNFDNLNNQSFTSGIYKTGDIGCWNSKGEIEFLGKKTDQLKVQGNRIQLSDIENAILEHPEIQDAAVVINEDSYKNNHLVAYYTKKTKEKELIEEQSKELLVNYSIKTHKRVIHKEVHNESISQLTISEIFEKSVKKHYDDIALIYEGKTMTYAELSSKVNHLAYILKSDYQIQNEDLVGIIMNRSEKLIITILAILKAGAAYVPIDAEYPESRIEQIVNDSPLNLFVLDVENHNKSADFNTSRLVYDSILDLNLNGEKTLENIGSAKNLAYILYTSGSTGAPKGVMVEQYSVVDYINTFTEYFELSSVDSVIQQSSISFDTSVEEIFPILCAGGRLVLFPEGGRDIDAMIASVNTNKITVLSSTPLVINELNQRINELTYHPRILISGGDQLRDSHYDKIPENIKLYNTYGPTEATVCASFARITKNTKCNLIGTPLKNHRIYVLDDQMREVPPGAIGQMYIAGLGVAKGYLNKKEETNKCFLSNVLGERVLYKTGDLAKWNEHGLLEFYGRKDSQVKIRGYRVEPAEVNAMVLSKKEIKDAYTTTKTDANGNKHLVTYYTSEIKIDNENLRTFLKEKLPHYMVSSYFINVEHFPMTTNGKVNVQELPIPYILSSDRKLNLELETLLKSKLPVHMIPDQFTVVHELPLTIMGKVDRKMLANKKMSLTKDLDIVLPANTIENKMLKIWQDCLNQRKISTDSNFFEIGGNSLKATQIVSQVFKEFGKTITLKDIYNNLSIIELSRCIENNEKDDNLIVKLKSSKKEYENIFFIPPIIGSSTIFKDLANYITGYNCYGLQCKGFDKETNLDTSIEEMATTFISEILKIQNHNRLTLVAYSMGVPVAFEMCKILERKSYDVKLVFIDRGVNDHPVQQIQDEESVLAELESELAFWFNDIPNQDKKRIKNLVLNNSKILDAYKVNGTIRSNIATIEASWNKHLAQMQDWNQYTTRRISHSYIEAYHYGILNVENLDILSKMIMHEIKHKVAHKELI